MRSPDFYPHAPASVEFVESHISWVFLAGDRAFKLRKPVVFPFLDYGTPERRRELCEEEVRLGRRLAPTSTSVFGRSCRSDGGWALGAPGEAGEEHVVEMRRFDESRHARHGWWPASRRMRRCALRGTAHRRVPPGGRAGSAGQLRRGRGRGRP